MRSLARSLVGLGSLAFGCHGFALSLPSSLKQQQAALEHHHHLRRHPGSSSSGASSWHGSCSRGVVGIVDAGGLSSPPSCLSSSTPRMSLGKF